MMSSLVETFEETPRLVKRLMETTYKKVIHQSTSEYTRGKTARQEGKNRKDEESMNPKTKHVKLAPGT